MKRISSLKRNLGSILAILSLSTYVIMLLTYIVFLTTILLLLGFIFIPLILGGVIRGNKNLIQKRVKGSCWALGILILILFPAFWRIPQQVYIRTNRQETLITPDVPSVQELADEFLAAHDSFSELSFEKRAEAVSNFTLEKVHWVVDYETYGMAGHVATPSQCIQKGKDDCQGQAVTMASLLLNLGDSYGFTHVWVVETPFHWYVLVRDPERGELEEGWEINVEKYQETEELLALNRDGRGSMPEWRLEEVVLIFNDEETLYPVCPFEALFIGWTATGFFYDDVFPVFLTSQVVLLFFAFLLLGIPLAFWSKYMMPQTNGKKGDKNTARIVRKVLIRGMILGMLLFGVFFSWFLLQPIIWDYTLILSVLEIGIILSLASEPIFWKSVR